VWGLDLDVLARTIPQANRQMAIQSNSWLHFLDSKDGV